MRVEKGDRVTLFLPNVPEFFFWFFGILKLSAVANRPNAMLKEREIGYITREYSPRVLAMTKSVAAEPLKVFRNPEAGIGKVGVIGGEREDDNVERDMVYFREDGCCYVKDRKKDVIVTGGFNIYPKEVEDLLCARPALAEAQVVGVPELIKGEIAVACIALRQGFRAGEDEIPAFCKDRIAGYKVPKQVRFFRELPKTVTGKLQKVTLRKILQGLPGTPNAHD
jgi:acyl-coenzyme A synthetase/AMP-(fatty) acid ligase